MLKVTVANTNADTEGYTLTVLALCVCFKKTLCAVMPVQQ